MSAVWRLKICVTRLCSDARILRYHDTLLLIPIPVTLNVYELNKTRSSTQESIHSRGSVGANRVYPAWFHFPMWLMTQIYIRT